jgi:hypothetical protein
MKPKTKALRRAYIGRNRKEERQVYHKNNRVYTGKKNIGSGHRAGEGWGESKNIDPESPIRVYSVRGRSPSFDQGVRNYKTKAHNRALTNKKIDKFFNNDKINAFFNK